MRSINHWLLKEGWWLKRPCVFHVRGAALKFWNLQVFQEEESWQCDGINAVCLSQGFLHLQMTKKRKKKKTEKKNTLAAPVPSRSSVCLFVCVLYNRSSSPKLPGWLSLLWFPQKVLLFATVSPLKTALTVVFSAAGSQFFLTSIHQFFSLSFPRTLLLLMSVFSAALVSFLFLPSNLSDSFVRASFVELLQTLRWICCRPPAPWNDPVTESWYRR